MTKHYKRKCSYVLKTEEKVFTFKNFWKKAITCLRWKGELVIPWPHLRGKTCPSRPGGKDCGRKAVARGWCKSYIPRVYISCRGWKLPNVKKFLPRQFWAMSDEIFLKVAWQSWRSEKLIPFCWIRRHVLIEIKHNSYIWPPRPRKYHVYQLKSHKR